MQNFFHAHLLVFLCNIAHELLPEFKGVPLNFFLQDFYLYPIHLKIFIIALDLHIRLNLKA